MTCRLKDGEILEEAGEEENIVQPATTTATGANPVPVGETEQSEAGGECEIGIYPYCYVEDAAGNELERACCKPSNPSV